MENERWHSKDKAIKNTVVKDNVKAVLDSKDINLSMLPTIAELTAMRTQAIPSLPSSRQHGAQLMLQFVAKYDKFPAQSRALYQVSYRLGL